MPVDLNSKISAPLPPVTKIFLPRAMIVSSELEPVIVAFLKSFAKSKVYAPMTETFFDSASPESFIVLPLTFKPSVAVAPLTVASVLETFFV